MLGLRVYSVRLRQSMMSSVDALRDLIRDGLTRASEPSPIELKLTRGDLACLFQAFGFTKGAEIGVEQGQYSQILCECNPDLELLCVDAWQAYPGYREHVTQEKLDGFFNQAVKRLWPYNAHLVRKFSVDAAEDVEDGSLDFVYIDGNHTLPQVIADLAAWTPKVRSGGIVSGHDYGRASVGHVREAVMAWTQAYRIEPWMLLTADRSPSWLWVQR
jgi:hypothetical protein